MKAYEEAFPKGSRVRVVDLARLLAFQESWKHHHPVTKEHLAYAGKPATVEEVAFYHGGDVLYVLTGIPRLYWHERCLEDAGS